MVKSKHNLNIYILERECLYTYEIFKVFENFVENFISRKYMSIFYLYFMLKE